MTHISYTQINTFRTCPAKYSRAYLEGNKRNLPTDLMNAGSKAHADIYKAIQANNLEALPDRFEYLFSRYFAGSYEIEFELLVSFGLTEIKGFIDLLAIRDSCAYMVDFKLNMIPDDDMQLELYALCLFYLYPELYFVDAWFFSINSNYYQHFEYSRADLQTMEAKFVKIYDEMLESDFDINPGLHCKNCDFVMDCAVKEKYRIEEETDVYKLIDLSGLFEGAFELCKDKIKKQLNHSCKMSIKDKNTEYYLTNSTTLRKRKVK